MFLSKRNHCASPLLPTISCCCCPVSHYIRLEKNNFLMKLVTKHFLSQRRQRRRRQMIETFGTYTNLSNCLDWSNVNRLARHNLTLFSAKQARVPRLGESHALILPVWSIKKISNRELSAKFRNFFLSKVSRIITLETKNV
jgi:hypothetical protein